MKFGIWQINLSNVEINEVNAGNDVPKFNASRDGMIGKFKPENFEFYDRVAEIKGDNLNDVFQVGNIGPEKYIERYHPMHSLSVGDIIEDEAGDMFVVAMFGFKKLFGDGAMVNN